MTVDVVSSVFTIPQALNTLQLPLGGASLPILFNFTGMVPAADLKIDISFSLNGISSVNYSTLVIN